MLLPIRCYTCGKVLGNLTTAWERHKKQLGNQKEEEWMTFFQTYRIERYCCRRVLMTQVADPNHQQNYQLPPSITISQDKVGNMFLAR